MTDDLVKNLKQVTIPVIESQIAILTALQKQDMVLADIRQRVIFNMEVGQAIVNEAKEKLAVLVKAVKHESEKYTDQQILNMCSEIVDVLNKGEAFGDDHTEGV